MQRMSDIEMRCFKAVQKWHRRQLLHSLKYAFLPQLPAYEKAMASSRSVQLLYMIFLIPAFPLVIIWWLVKSTLQLLRFPYLYLISYLVPQSLRSPGERNIQGIHNAFSRHTQLNTAFYIHCVNDWVAILYGDEAARQHRLEHYLFAHTSNIRQLSDQFSRNSISMARESLSRALGYY